MPLFLQFLLLLALLVGLTFVDYRQTLRLLAVPAYRYANLAVAGLVDREGGKLVLFWGPLMIAAIAMAISFPVFFWMPSAPVLMLLLLDLLWLWFVVGNWRQLRTFSA